MCKVIKNPCRIVEWEHRGGWPDFMRCDDNEKFPQGCKVYDSLKLMRNFFFFNQFFQYTE